MYFGLHGLQSLLGVVFCEDQIVSKQTAHIIFCIKPSPTLVSHQQYNAIKEEYYTMLCHKCCSHTYWTHFTQANSGKYYVLVLCTVYYYISLQ